MKKSLLALSLAAILLTGLTGCDNADKINKAVTTTVETASMAVDDNHSLVLDSDGILWATGVSTDGEFGMASTSLTTLTQIATDVSDYAKGENSTLIVKTDGSLWATGDNDYGQLGLGTTTDVSTWTQVLSSGVSKVETGDNSTLIIKTDGTVWATGANSCGQIGLGTTASVNIFTQISGITGAKDIQVSKRGWNEDVNGEYSAIIKNDGTLWVAGANVNGQLGLGTNINVNTFTQVSGFTNVEKVSLGAWHSALVTSDNKLYVTGDNFFGQLANGTSNSLLNTVNYNTFTLAASNATDVSAGLTDTVYVGTDGYTYGAGDAFAGILGTGNETDLTSFGKGTLSGVSKVYAGRITTLVLTTTGNLYAAGSNGNGQFGNGTTTDSTTLLEVSAAE